jgi:hypothetical protein
MTVFLVVAPCILVMFTDVSEVLAASIVRANLKVQHRYQSDPEPATSISYPHILFS